MSQPTSPPEPATGYRRTERISDLCAIAFDGPDAAAFLQGYLTCDTELLDDRQLRPAALCNLQGRVVANGWAGRKPSAPDLVLFFLHASVADTVLHFLSKYMVFSKTSARIEQPAGTIAATVDAGASAAADRGCVIDARRVLYFDLSASADPAGDDRRWQTALIEDRLVVVRDATSAKFLPQMLGLDRWGAVDFSKGCYLGQEVVARAQHRGAIKRVLVAGRLEAGDDGAAAQVLLLPGTGLQDEHGNVTGTVVGAVPQSWRQPQPAAHVLAVVKSNFSASGPRRLQVIDANGLPRTFALT